MRLQAGIRNPESRSGLEPFRVLVYPFFSCNPAFQCICCNMEKDRLYWNGTGSCCGKENVHGKNSEYWLPGL